MVTTPKYPAVPGYVQAIGDSKKVTRWGLSQTDAGKIMDAYVALKGRFVWPANAQEHEDALNGAVAIYEKAVGGWPGFTGVTRDRSGQLRPPLTEEETQEDLELVVQNCYRFLTSLKGNWFPMPGSPDDIAMHGHPLPPERLDARSAQGRALTKALLLRIKPAVDSASRLETWNQVWRECGFDEW
jgi:hypothetical protein